MANKSVKNCGKMSSKKASATNAKASAGASNKKTTNEK